MRESRAARGGQKSKASTKILGEIRKNTRATLVTHANEAAAQSQYAVAPSLALALALATRGAILYHDCASHSAVELRSLELRAA